MFYLLRIIIILTPWFILPIRITYLVVYWHARFMRDVPAIKKYQLKYLSHSPRFTRDKLAAIYANRLLIQTIIDKYSLPEVTQGNSHLNKLRVEMFKHRGVFDDYYVIMRSTTSTKAILGLFRLHNEIDDYTYRALLNPNHQLYSVILEGTKYLNELPLDLSVLSN